MILQGFPGKPKGVHVFASDFIDQVLPAIVTRHPAVSAIIEDNDDDHIFLASLMASAQGLAAPGHAFLRDLLTHADANEIVVELEVAADLESRTGKRLIAFYQKFGFVDDENGWCMRLPQPVIVPDPVPPPCAPLPCAPLPRTTPPTAGVRRPRR
jgi:hypothetical protein